MTVSAHEFLRRFLLHVLPGDLVRIRHFGIFANRRHVVSSSFTRMLAEVPRFQRAALELRRAYRKRSLIVVFTLLRARLRQAVLK